MQRENITGKPRKFSVAGENNAFTGDKDHKQFRYGDEVLVQPGAPLTRGELVLAECSKRECGWKNHPGKPHHHVLYYFPLNGKKYSFRLSLSKHRTYGTGTRYTPGEEKMIVGPVVKVIPKGGQREKARGRRTGSGRTSHYRVSWNWPYFGIHQGDVLTVKENGQAAVGQLALIRYDSEDRQYFSRVCCVKDNVARVCGNNSNPHDEPLSLIIGTVIEIDHTDCGHTKIEALRQKLAELQGDTDHTLNLTRAFEVEKEIYDLEHPIEEEEEDNSWPEVIGDES